MISSVIKFPPKNSEIKILKSLKKLIKNLEEQRVNSYLKKIFHISQKQNTNKQESNNKKDQQKQP